MDIIMKLRMKSGVCEIPVSDKTTTILLEQKGPVKVWSMIEESKNLHNMEKIHCHYELMQNSFVNTNVPNELILSSKYKCIT